MIETLQTPENSKSAFLSLFEYWKSIKGAFSCPKKSDFSPSGIKGILEEIAIMEITDDQTDVVFRLIAAGIRQRSQIDLTGMSALAACPEKDRQPVLESYLVAQKHVCGAAQQIDLIYEEGFVSTVDSFYLPLADEDGKAKFFVALFYMRDKYSFDNADLGSMPEYVLRQLQFIDLGNGIPEKEVLNFS